MCFSAHDKCDSSLNECVMKFLDISVHGQFFLQSRPQFAQRVSRWTGMFQGSNLSFCCLFKTSFRKSMKLNYYNHLDLMQSLSIITYLVDSHYVHLLLNQKCGFTKLIHILLNLFTFSIYKFELRVYFKSATIPVTKLQCCYAIKMSASAFVVFRFHGITSHVYREKYALFKL